MGKGSRTAVLLIGAFVAGAFGGEPPPVDPILKLRQTWADKHADIGVWAAGKKLMGEAKGHFLLALRLDPECREAHSRLGHRRGADGKWAPGKEPAWNTAPETLEKYGAEYRKRAGGAFREQAAAFEEQGLLLLGTNDFDLGRRFLLLAALLSPDRKRAIEGLGLVPLSGSFGTRAEVEAVNLVAEAGPGACRYFGTILNIETQSRTCGSATVEGQEDPSALATAARKVHQSQLLTSLRFDLPSAEAGWVVAGTVPTQQKFEEYLDLTKPFEEPYLSGLKKLGTARGGKPRHFFIMPVPPKSGLGYPTQVFVHYAAENRLWQYRLEGLPIWFTEAAGVDACLALLGVPGPPCIAVEETAALRFKDALKDAQDWGGQALLGALTRGRPWLADLMTAKVGGIELPDVMFSLLVYRYLLATRRSGLQPFLLSESPDPDIAFKEGFGKTPAYLEAELVSVLCGEREP